MNRKIGFLLVGIVWLIVGCATTIQTSSLMKPRDPLDTITVKAFSYADKSIGLEAGIYTLEFESADGFFYRGPGLAVQIPPAINMNIANYPESKFPGGLFVPRNLNPKGYRLYYYQFNLAGSPGPGSDTVISNSIAQTSSPAANPVISGVGAGVGGGIVNYMIESGRGQIALIAATKEIVIASFVSKP